MSQAPIIVENFRLIAAMAYALRGWLVFPIHTPVFPPSGAPRCSCGHPECGKTAGKHPRTENGLKDATLDEQQVRQWWHRWPGANVGIVTGSASGIVVLDIDPDKGGWDSYGALCDEHGQLPETVEVETGGGGRHLFFHHPPGKRIQNSAKKLGAGLDVRGDGGYVVAPPSQHLSGRRYCWRAGLGVNAVPLAPMPEWLITLTSAPTATEPKSKPNAGGWQVDRVDYWLGKALTRTRHEGNRNDTGFWLATQLRDEGVSQAQAESVLRDFAARTPRGESPYTEREAAASVRSAYQAPRRMPATTAGQHRRPQPQHTEPPKVQAVSTGAAAELKAYLDGVSDGRIIAVPWPWPSLTTMTFAHLPGSVTCVVGDPGVGKTFFVLQCLQFWISNGIQSRVFFIEKDRRFHTMRLLAQIEGESKWVDYEWLPGKSVEIEGAMKRHGPIIDELGKHMDTAPLERVTLDSLLAWMRQYASAGCRMLVVDPITAVSAGDQRWLKDEDFMIEAQRIMTDHGCSLLIITHAKKGNRPGSPSGHDMAGGAAYYRFGDTAIWLLRSKKPRKIQYRTKLGPASGKFDLFFQLHKTRNGKAKGYELAYSFGDGLKFAEQGVVIRDLANEEEGAA